MSICNYVPSESSREIAAQLWQLPQHQDKDMDPDFAESIASVINIYQKRVQVLEVALNFYANAGPAHVWGMPDGQVYERAGDIGADRHKPVLFGKRARQALKSGEEAENTFHQCTKCGCTEIDIVEVTRD